GWGRGREGAGGGWWGWGGWGRGPGRLRHRRADRRGAVAARLFLLLSGLLRLWLRLPRLRLRLRLPGLQLRLRLSVLLPRRLWRLLSALLRRLLPRGRPRARGAAGGGPPPPPGAVSCNRCLSVRGPATTPLRLFSP